MLMSTTISSVVHISPPDAVSRRGVSWTGMAGEIVQANRRGRINFHFRAPVHMLAMYQRSVRYEGRTLIQGLPPSRAPRGNHRTSAGTNLKAKGPRKFS
jgi:AraC family transcriptional regulator